MILRISQQIWRGWRPLDTPWTYTPIDISTCKDKWGWDLYARNHMSPEPSNCRTLLSLPSLHPLPSPARFWRCSLRLSLETARAGDNGGGGQRLYLSCAFQSLCLQRLAIWAANQLSQLSGLGLVVIRLRPGWDQAKNSQQYASGKEQRQSEMCREGIV